jgi:hypothetical protein
MADTRKFLQVQATTTAGAGVSATATTIVLSSLVHLAAVGGGTVAMTDIGTLGWATLEPGTSREEIISFTGITQNGDGTATITGVTRNLKSYAPYDQYSATGYAHAGGATFIITNNPQMYDSMANKANDETITGLWDFSTSIPTLPASNPTSGNQATRKTYVDGLDALAMHLAGTETVTGVKTFTSTAKAKYDTHPTFTADEEIIDKKYADDLAIAGAPNASTTVKGIVEEATQAEVDAGTATGGTGARLFVNPSVVRGKFYHDYAADAGANDTYTITVSPAPTAYTTGDVYIFKANTANTGAATLNVNSLGAKTIKKNSTSDLETGDLIAGQIVTVVYDGTNMQIQGPVKNLAANVGTFTKDVSEVTGSTTTITHGLATTPRLVRISLTTNSAGDALQTSLGSYNGTNYVRLFTLYDISSAAMYQSQSTTDIVLISRTGVYLTEFQTATVTTLNSTSIILTWTKTGSPTGTYTVMWEALA